MPPPSFIKFSPHLSLTHQHKRKHQTNQKFQIRSFSFKCRERERERKGRKNPSSSIPLLIHTHRYKSGEERERESRMSSSFSLSRGPGSSRLQFGGVMSQRQRSLSVKKPPEPLRRAVADCLSSASSSPGSSLHGNPSIAASEATRTLRVRSNSSDLVGL